MKGRRGNLNNYFIICSYEVLISYLEPEWLVIILNGRTKIFATQPKLKGVPDSCYSVYFNLQPLVLLFLVPQ